MYIYNKNHETMFYSVTKCSFTLLWCYCVIQYVYSYWPPKPEAQFPEEVPPPAVHSVLVVQTPCFTLMSPVAQTSLGNCTILNNENPVEGDYEQETIFDQILLLFLLWDTSSPLTRVRVRQRAITASRPIILGPGPAYNMQNLFLNGVFRFMSLLSSSWL